MLTRIYLGLNDSSGRPLPSTDVDRSAAIFGRFFPHGFTSWRASGHWQGASEPVLIFEVATLDSEAVFSAASALRTEMRQTAVLVVEIAGARATMVEARGALEQAAELPGGYDARA